jgi:hypothetical protein
MIGRIDKANPPLANAMLQQARWRPGAIDW